MKNAARPVPQRLLGLQYGFRCVFGEKWRQLSTCTRHQGSHGGDGYTEGGCNLCVTEAIQMIEADRHTIPTGATATVRIPDRFLCGSLVKGL